MSKKMRVGVIFGGQSGEHEISILSARSVMENLDPQRYEILPIGISKEGKWYVGMEAFHALACDPPKTLLEKDGDNDFARLTSWQPSLLAQQEQQSNLDIIIPVLHGPHGEDGTVQGLLELLNIPYVGAGVLASAVGMDKAMMKTVFAHAGLPQCKYSFFLRRQWEQFPSAVIARVESEIGYPCFVKPANMGSSVGISKAKDRMGLQKALAEAAMYDRKLLVEEAVDAREIEVAVLGNDEPRASVPGEIVSSSEFYDYNTKYEDGKAELIIPADLSAAQKEEVRQMAIAAFQAIDGAGLSRVDFFLDRQSGKFLINEINTFPGFTIYSMFPKLWEATGIPYPRLLDELIRLALERHQEKMKTAAFRA